MAQAVTAPRGTQDVVPPDSRRWSELESRIRSLAGRFGYGEIRTPMFESTELFVRGVGDTTDIVEKEMYRFRDRSDRDLTLRPEFTAPVVRAALERRLLDGERRLFYIGPDLPLRTSAEGPLPAVAPVRGRVFRRGRTGGRRRGDLDGLGTGARVRTYRRPP